MSVHEKFPKNFGIRLFCGVLLLLLIGFLIHYSGGKDGGENVENTELSTFEQAQKLCEEKVVADFQLVDPGFSWEGTSITDNNDLRGKVVYYEGDETYGETDFLCTLSANGSDARISWDIDIENNEEEVIYDDRESGVDNTRGEVEERFERDGHL